MNRIVPAALGGSGTGALFLFRFFWVSPRPPRASYVPALSCLWSDHHDPHDTIFVLRPPDWHPDPLPTKQPPNHDRRR